MRIRSILIGSAIVMLATATSVAFAGPRTHDIEIFANNGAKRIVIQSNDDVGTYSSTTFIQVTATDGFINIPAAQTGILVATFTAESNCSGTPGSWCSIRIICDGVELQPPSGIDLGFNSVGTVSSTSSWKSLTVTRHSQPFTGGSHSCDVQAANSVAGNSHSLDDWTFVIEFWRKS